MGGGLKHVLVLIALSIDLVEITTCCTPLARFLTTTECPPLVRRQMRLGRAHISRNPLLVSLTQRDESKASSGKNTMEPDPSNTKGALTPGHPEDV